MHVPVAAVYEKCFTSNDNNNILDELCISELHA